MCRAGEESGSGKLSFKEKLPHHVDFTMMVVMEWDHLNKCRSELRKKYVSRLKPGMSLPHRATCIKIMQVIKMLMGQKLSEQLKILVHDLGSPCVGAQSDIFSLKNCSEARLWLRSQHKLASPYAFSPLSLLRAAVLWLPPPVVHLQDPEQPG